MHVRDRTDQRRAGLQINISRAKKLSVANELVSNGLSFVVVNCSKYKECVLDDVDMGALVTVCALAITLMLIYGAARGKPAHLLPFFCVQILDFAITM